MEPEIIFSRSGYEYRYRIGMDDAVISLYRAQLDRSCARNGRSCILEVRTNFVLKPSSGGGEQILDSERFANIFPVSIDHSNLPEFVNEGDLYWTSISFRLREYWLPEDEIRRVAREALCFSKRMSADPQNASLRVIPVVVYIDVFTLQLHGELLDATICRSIKPDCLIPIGLWGMCKVPGEQKDEDWSIATMMYVLKLPKERVLEGDVAVASARMESCTICSEAPTYGTVITPLPDCDHVFHNHCIIRWLRNHKSTACPVCCSEIVVNRRP